MIENFYNDIKIALEKIAIFVSVKTDNGKDYFLVTRNPQVISFFNDGFSQVPYSVNKEQLLIEAFEIRYDKIVTLDVRNVSEIYYYGIPQEISPPMYLNPAFKGFLNEDMVREFQKENFLERVKREKNNGEYQGNEKLKQHNVDFFNLKYFFKTEYNIVAGDDPLFSFFDDYYMFNFDSNVYKGEKILELHKTMYFLPAILKCAGKTKDEIKSILPQLIDKTIFSKEKWIEVLKQRQQELLVSYTQERDSLDTVEEGEDMRQLLTAQYDQLIEKLANISFESELSLYNDYRLYLRFWPELFAVEEFHAYIRPFTELENNVIKQFIKNNVTFDLDEIYRREYDFFNSIIYTLEKYADAWRELMIKKIESKAKERYETLLQEFESMSSALSDEEKSQLMSTIEEVKNIEKYRDRLNSLDRLVDIMSFWPLELYPKPDDILIL